jgi:hypothetical protein
MRFFSPKSSDLWTRDPDRLKKWKFFKEEIRLRIDPPFLIRPQTKIFCMGSCFALEIKKVLRDRGYAVRPEEPGKGVELVHFNTFTMLQEFEKAFGLWKQDPDDFWYVDRAKSGKTYRYFQDPYRRQVYAESLEGIRSMTAEFDRAVRQGIDESDLYILTLGLVEVWKKKNNGRYAYAQPGDSHGGGHGEVDFVQSNFEENFSNLKKMVQLIQSKFPERHVVVTVSPVPLSHTFGGNDVFTANAESKAVLRAVAGQLSRDFRNVHYFPSFEICSMAEKYGLAKVYEADGRHVRKKTVETIMEIFLEAYRAP